MKKVALGVILAGFLVFSISCGKSQPPAPPVASPAADKPASAEYVHPAGLKFVPVPAGSFRMGSESPEAGTDERPVHNVRITRAFQMQTAEVTQAQWKAVMGPESPNPSRHQGEALPVDSVSWDMTQAFIQKLNEKGEGRFRLPTEAEWEYACRAGTVEDCYGPIPDIAWFEGNSGRKPHPAGQKKANAWGLSDMLGNVWEWCDDLYGESVYAKGDVTDPRGAAGGALRVLRGGAWGSQARQVRSSARNKLAPEKAFPDVGFRLVREGEK